MQMGPQAGNKSRLNDLLLASDEGDIDGALRFYAPDVVDHDATEARQSRAGTSLEGLRDALRSFSSAFTDSRALVLRTAHDEVVARASPVPGRTAHR